MGDVVQFNPVRCSALLRSIARVRQTFQADALPVTLGNMRRCAATEGCVRARHCRREVATVEAGGSAPPVLRDGSAG